MRSAAAPLAVLAFLALALAGGVADAATYTAGPFSYTLIISASQTTGHAAGTSHSAALGLLYQLVRAQAPSSAGAPHSVGLGWGGLIIHKDSSGNVLAEIQIGPGISDQPITVTQTVTQVTTTTTTITKTITGPGGTTVITEVATVTVPADSEGGGVGGLLFLAAAGAAMLAYVLLVNRRG